MLKFLVLVILVAIGVFLFRRAKRLAKEEQVQSAKQAAQQERTTPSETDSLTQSESSPTTSEAAAIEVSEDKAPEPKPIEAELMPREAPHKTASDVGDDIVDAEIVAPEIDATNTTAAGGQSVIKVNSTGDAQSVKPTASEAFEQQLDEPQPVSAKPQAAASPETDTVSRADAIPNSVPEFVPAQTSEVITSSAPLANVADSHAKPVLDDITFASVDWANVTLQRAAQEYQQATSNAERFNALQNMIGECYKQRKSAQYRDYGAQLAEDYLALHATASKEAGAELKTPGFLQLATLLNDSQAFDAAINLCQHALALGLSDGTVTGFEGRIARIEKAKAKALG